MLRNTALPLFAAVSVFGQITNTLTTPSSVPPVGLAVTETAQVNVVNTAVASSLVSGGGVPGGSASGGTTGPSCSGSIAFYNSKGAIIGSAATFTVTTGQIFSVALPYSSTAGSGARTVIRAVITNQTPITALGIPPCDLAYSMEIYDTATGVAHAVVSGVVAPPLGPIHIGISPTAP
jgi:hypothetical protein